MQARDYHQVTRSTADDEIPRNDAETYGKQMHYAGVCEHGLHAIRWAIGTLFKTNRNDPYNVYNAADDLEALCETYSQTNSNKFRCALYFQISSWCFEMWSNTVFRVLHISYFPNDWSLLSLQEEYLGRLFESSGISGEVTLLLLKCSLSPASWWEEEKSQSSGREDKQVGFKIAFSCTRISTND